jgi:hypothetical protein
MPRFAAAIVVVALAGAAGCMIDEKRFNPPFACYNQPLPPMALDPVIISGTVRDPFTASPIKQAPVEGFEDELTGGPIFTTKTDDAGFFTRSQGTGNAPRKVHLHASSPGYVDTYFYPAVPITQNLNATLVMFTPADFMMLATAVGLPAIDPSKALVAVGVVDCNDRPVGGATVTTSQAMAGRVYLNSNVTPDPTATETDEHTGTAIFYNVSPSSVTINATVGGMTLRSHSIMATASTLTQAEIQP